MASRAAAHTRHSASLAALLFLLLPLLTVAPAMACGPDTDCIVPDGTYRIRMPESWNGQSQVGAIVFLHGWKGTAAGEMRNGHLAKVVSDMGLALIAPQGAEKSWSFPGSPRQRRDDIAFMNSVLDDAIAEHSIAPERIMASGFSVGGSMVWYLACYMGERFAGFAPVAGAFWEPQPVSCPGPEPYLFHVHGTADKTVPMQGRAIGTMARQGDVGVGFEMWFDKGSCGAEVPEESAKGTLVCERRVNCAGKVIELCLHPGGHKFDAAWLKRAWTELAELKGWNVAKYIQPN
ncbi:polyhydroxybutyrate depolymerase [Breoghania sp. L-A4]|uniref:alpha/beta hydrolase family esterase n=1 Tax=Breoghania sp. L-A4 TaxID=2304600 RepID=UPI000E35B546|nr:polyhydroxybutyrate depolymerase [Breoghania sp. L-A4]AXS39352.1 polyhydroxybutyrate depolymerase [Breoghania sp. L-A4]